MLIFALGWRCRLKVVFENFEAIGVVLALTEELVEENLEGLEA